MEPVTDPGAGPEPGRWPVWKLALLLYPFTAAAVAINLFLGSLIFRAVGWQSLDPWQSVVIAVFLGIPVTWAAGRWARHLMDQADA